MEPTNQHLERKMIWTKPPWGHVPAVNLPGCRFKSCQLRKKQDRNYQGQHEKHFLPSLKLTASLQLNMDDWNLPLFTVDTENLPLFIGFDTCQVVVWDFFHQPVAPEN